VIRTAHEQGKKIHVLVDETRPRLQGARLTAWELEQYGIPYEIISDNTAGYFLKSWQSAEVFCWFRPHWPRMGTWRTRSARTCWRWRHHDNGVPFYPVVPTSTVDLSLAHGDLIPIEERNPQEVLGLEFEGQRVAPQNAKARNIAFDVTPNSLSRAL
jgi:methylthioribose-1-phosphate isomerase